MDFSSVLDFSKPLDVTIFDQLVSTFYNSSGPKVSSLKHFLKQIEAGDVLKQYQQHQNAWETVDKIIEQSKNINSKYIALQVLEKFIQNKWSALPKEHSEAIKNFVVSIIIKTSSSEAEMQSERLILNKLNVILVQVLIFYLSSILLDPKIRMAQQLAKFYIRVDWG